VVETEQPEGIAPRDLSRGIGGTVVADDDVEGRIGRGE
jgi:hypothetical protein